ncbi:hypothetical protein [Lysinibacter cavernae]|uniref:DUF4352 domain-containing protein n=1 Tax=Lysinibacter cavernae TaxID=1640652 RepID=A0A7X5R4J6_9MICO|nr:hypothetical protein [Lysinibacter cavernae]NIH55190.1 hypothetical protein [Lysinibacter cavernae]
MKPVNESSSTKTSQPTSTPEPTTSSPTPSATTGQGSFTAASWSNPIAATGESLGAIEGDTVRADIYQAAIGAASRDSSVVDATTKEPLTKAGDPLVALEFVVTNTSDETIYVDDVFATDSVRNDNFVYTGGINPSVEYEWFAEAGLFSSAVNVDKRVDNNLYELLPGESAAWTRAYKIYSPENEVEILMDGRLADGSRSTGPKLLNGTADVTIKQ